MENPVTVTDLEERWRPLTPAERVNAGALLADAWSLVTGPTGRSGLPADLDAGSVPVGSVVAVLSAAVLRVLRNPDGKVSETIDDYAYRRADGVSDGSLYLTADELARLTPAAVDVTRGAFTIRPGAPNRVVAGSWPGGWPGVC